MDGAWVQHEEHVNTVIVEVGRHSHLQMEILSCSIIVEGDNRTSMHIEISHIMPRTQSSVHKTIFSPLMAVVSVEISPRKFAGVDMVYTCSSAS